MLLEDAGFLITFSTGKRNIILKYFMPTEIENFSTISQKLEAADNCLIMLGVWQSWARCQFQLLQVQDLLWRRRIAPSLLSFFFNFFFFSFFFGGGGIVKEKEQKIKKKKKDVSKIWS